MKDLPELGREVSESVENHARNLCPWLPDPKTCEDCGALCRADVVYDPVMGDPEGTSAWVCPNGECEAKYYRIEPWHDS